MVSTLLLMAAVRADLRVLMAPERILEIGPRGAALLRWGLLADMLGYYLLLAPAGVYLYQRMKPRAPQRMTLATLGGLGYVLIGAMGAAVLASVLPPLIEAAAALPAEERGTVSTVAMSVINAVYGALWNPLEVLLAGAWWLGIRPLLRAERPGFARLTGLLGAAAWLDAAGFMLGLEPIFLLGLAGVLALVPVWTVWLGVLLLRREL